LFIGLLIALDESKKKEINIALAASQWKHFATTIAVVVIIIASAFWGWRIVAKALSIREANVAVTQSKTSDEALAYLSKATSYDSSMPVLYQIAAQAYLSKAAQIMSLPADQALKKKDEAQSDITNAINNALVAEQLDPTDFKSRIVTGRVLEYLGTLGVPNASKQAAAKYISASTLSPSNPLPFVFAANVYITLGDSASAKNALVQAITLKSDWSDTPDVAQGINSMITALNKGANPISSATSTSPKTEAKTKQTK
jgi:tetratricopeptide (TPR) repeat protein